MTTEQGLRGGSHHVMPKIYKCNLFLKPKQTQERGSLPMEIDNGLLEFKHS
jgi:hypothetical protein